MTILNSARELRFLLSQRCNYECSFCHKEGLQSFKTEKLDAEDYKFIFHIGQKVFGLHNTTLTGGEPLVRKDISDIVSGLAENLARITITSNGFLLDKCMHIGKYIDRLNISLHTLDMKKYESIVSRENVFSKTLNNIINFRDKYPKVGICLNSTLSKTIHGSEDEYWKLIDFAKSINASIKFIELYPQSSKNLISLRTIEKLLLANNFKSISGNSVRKVEFSNGFVTVGLTKIFCALSLDQNNPMIYCNQNNDLFVSPDGKIKPCRNNKFEIDLLDDVKAQDEIGLINKLQLAFASLGKFCQHGFGHI